MNDKEPRHRLWDYLQANTVPALWIVYMIVAVILDRVFR